MSAEFNNKSLALGLSQPTLNFVANYAELLDTYNIHYISSEYYWEVGDLKTAGDWILNLSVIKRQLSKLLHVIVPFLIKMNVPFKIIRDESTAQYALDGHLGPAYLGKMVSVYPPNSKAAVTLAKELIILTGNFKGPAVRTDRCLAGIVYTSLKTCSTIPFSIPPNTFWPFNEIVGVVIPPKPKLLNFSYYPTSVIKADAKGDVIKALYFKKIWSIKSCVIKQGRANMFMDIAGRDIQDRLQWQYELHSQLADKLPLPKIFDYFMSDGDSYIAMQTISGISFTSQLKKLYNDRIWYDLPSVIQLEIVDHLLIIIDIVRRLHEMGYVHRDITPENFLLDKTNKIWMIDVELMWSAKMSKPSPPFGLGTPGFISPEQDRIKLPTEKEDIYAIGALMMAFFTNLAPVKFQHISGDSFKNNIHFFVKSEPVASVISDCLAFNPDQRPDVSSIVSCLSAYRQLISQGEISPIASQTNANQSSSHDDLRTVIQLALNGVTSPLALDSTNRWLSYLPSDSKVIGNEQQGMTVQLGWYQGVTGPLWLLALACQNGFDISRGMTAYEANWQYIHKQYFSNKITAKTLYGGSAGIALALTEGLNSDLLPADSLHIEHLKNCFSKKEQLPTLAEGLAGQGIAVLYASRWLEQKYREELLSAYIDQLVNTQQLDGTWRLSETAAMGKSICALNHGISGIIWFLLCYLQYNPNNPEVRIMTIKALNWLKGKLRKKGNDYIRLDIKPGHQWTIEKGIPGIALLWIKAHQVLQTTDSRNLAETLLNDIPPRPVITNFTLGTGLAGIGELYLEAFNVFQNEIWRSRAEWIAQLLIRTLNFGNKGEGYWLPDYQSSFTADLFMGNSGIIHFLMRSYLPKSLPYPLDPIMKI
jgi:serine/threonine protein kinase